MHDGMQYDPIQGQGHEPSKVEIRPFSEAFSSAIYNGSWQLTMDGTMSKVVRAGFLMSGLVFLVSRDFELGTNVSCEELTISPRTGLIFLSCYRCI